MPELHDPTATFQEFDRDADGYITREEFTLAMSSRGEEVTAAELDSIFKVSDEHDGDVDGRISLAEFLVAWHK
ncbi:Ca2+-binding EF-hand superfamily protein [Nonomuraea thailandensis]|uniref:Ca2+-binding EF-hand superfamily protein n=1 Tax=Nonomuraea thailandensis TaxID=1188745 RepID=A0A9X2K368_9ACTN|nr:EF-hand domain-containing protein [Nonomuraea thailandensis]MCP2357790.1 Ca2+-binding EF-hand superfamily protein [Nonomuraea thailandensis]